MTPAFHSGPGAPQGLPIMRKLIGTSHVYLLPTKAAAGPWVPTFNRRERGDSLSTWPHVPKPAPIGTTPNPPSGHPVFLPRGSGEVEGQDTAFCKSAVLTIKTVKLSGICKDCFHFEAGSSCTSKSRSLPVLHNRLAFISAMPGSHLARTYLLLSALSSFHPQEKNWAMTAASHLAEPVELSKMPSIWGSCPALGQLCTENLFSTYTVYCHKCEDKDKKAVARKPPSKAHKQQRGDTSLWQWSRKQRGHHHGECPKLSRRPWTAGSCTLPDNPAYVTFPVSGAPSVCAYAP